MATTTPTGTPTFHHRQFSRAGHGWIRTLLLTAMMFACVAGNAQNELRQTFFKDADAAKAAADAANAKLLAPRSYERGMKDYQDAEESLQRGRNVETVRSEASSAAQNFLESTKAAQLASTALAQLMKSRQDAANARAPELAADEWQDAQQEFADAIRRLERGDLKGAQHSKIEATDAYRSAELIAIKAQYLTETRRLLAEADKARVGRYAPITLDKAKQLLADAEKELNENRYDTDLPRSLAQQANYEARHAIYLSNIVLKVHDKDMTTEELVLQWEEQMRAIAGAADVLPDMADGPDALTKSLVSYVDKMRNDNQQMTQQVAEDTARLKDLQDELTALDARLGGATAERTALMQRLEAQERVKQQFEQVEKMFTEQEAHVFREGDSVILRLVGLDFDSGKADIKPDNFSLLAKVEKAIDVFPRSELTIEGHTDSYGGDDLNQKLSQSRAESVRQYMINAMRIPTYRLIATGYGETRPVASNETAAGRAQNRRIDIVIKPNPAAAENSETQPAANAQGS